MLPYSALVDANTNILLALSIEVSAVVFTNECTSDTSHVIAVNYPNYLEKKFFWQKRFPLSSISPTEYPLWSWDNKNRKFRKTREELLTESIRAKSALAHQKIRAIAQIMHSLSASRQSLKTGVEFQETTYLLKREQARAYKASAADESHLHEFPFVSQYADFAGISPAQAADDILFRAELDDDVLLRSEGTRLKFFEKMKKASSAQEIQEVLRDYRRESYLNANI